MHKIRLKDGSIIEWPDGRPLPDGAAYYGSLYVRDSRPAPLTDVGSVPLASFDSAERAKVLYLADQLVATTNPFARENLARNLIASAAKPGVSQYDRDFVKGIVKAARALR